MIYQPLQSNINTESEFKTNVINERSPHASFKSQLNIRS